MANNVPKAFKIIIQHFSGKTLHQSQEEIYDRVKALDQDEGSAPVTLDDVKRTLRYLNYFDLAEKPRPRCCWHIKSVNDMCTRLHALGDNYNIGNDPQCLTVSIAFEIIIHHFCGDTVSRSTTDIEERVKNVGGFPPDDLADPLVSRTLRFLNHFGFAEENGSDWCVKSVDDMCARLRDIETDEEIL